MKYSIILLIPFLWCLPAKQAIAQAGRDAWQLDKEVHDFGDIEAGDPRLADFRLTNTGSEEIFFLRADVPDDCIIRYSERSVKPGASAIIRVKFNPERKGLFVRNIDVYQSASPEALELRIKGNVKVVEENGDMACPDFNTATEQKQVTSEFAVQVIDKRTQLPISAATVKYHPNPLPLAVGFTGPDGFTRAHIPIGRYSILAQAKGYESSVQELYIGKNTTSTLFMLEPLPETIDSTPVVAERPPVEAPRENPGELPLSTYGANNIVFLIDISSSMGTSDKLPLLKVSMNKLLYSLRSIDRISIVTYATGTDVLLPSTPANEKQDIEKKINKLQAYGSTQGGKGIKEAYKVAEANFIKGGNNQIILATDGDFNLDKSDKALFDYIKDETDKSIGLSVVGFGKKVKAIEKMQKIAQSGQGSYIHISPGLDTTEVLVEEIKQRSHK